MDKGIEVSVFIRVLELKHHLFHQGFRCSGVEGEDVVRLLQEAISRRNDIQVKVAAILNDTTGCLMSCAWKNPKCRIGLIIGTGTNACYLEDLDKVHQFM